MYVKYHINTPNLVCHPNPNTNGYSVLSLTERVLARGEDFVVKLSARDLHRAKIYKENFSYTYL